MSFFVFLIVLISSRFLRLNSGAYRDGWQQGYCSWIEKHFVKSVHENGLLGLLLLLVPVVVVIMIIFLVVYHTIGVVGYFILDCVLLWFCLDFRDVTVEQYSVARLRGVFGIIFWFVLLGPFGTLVYFTTESMHRYFESTRIEDHTSKAVCVFLNILDWLPARLLGLSVALVGSFAAVMKSWIQGLAAPLKKIPEYVTGWCELAIEKQHVELEKQEKSALISLLDRALWVWLIVIGLINLGMWLG
ncbi:MAG: regulatory signaling modulator protein AmpE [Gammaproteobacteria bacterium]|nr:regulatory signaling modulator protein AmpE [Gammaproteobacteria bacterium]MCH9744709.1 regulatory signaling modulator protein AmpE [Gammaproteobacteria bacterium]